METSKPKQCASDLNQAQVVDRLFVVANEDSAALGRPAQGSFDHPASRLCFVVFSLALSFSFMLRFFLSTDGIALDPQAPILRDQSWLYDYIALVRNGLLSIIRVITFIQAKVLWVSFRGFWSSQDDCLQCRSEEF